MQGKHVILFIFGTAIAAAVFAWTFQYLRGRRVLELWGVENARLIRVEGKQLNLLSLDRPVAGDTSEPSAGKIQTINIDGRSYRATGSKDISNAPGLIHARQALITDASFLWDKPRGACEADWRYALEFRHDERSATVLLDTNCQRARLLGTDHEAAIAPKIFQGWMIFIDEQLEVNANSAPGKSDRPIAEDAAP